MTVAKFKPRTSGINTGAASELTACAYFLNLGYAVYRSVSGNAAFDLVIYKDGNLQRVEVKTGLITARQVANGSWWNKPATQHCDLLAVVLDGEVLVYDRTGLCSL